MDDLALIIRHCKRSRSTKLDLSGKGLSSIPQDIYQLTDLEVVDVSNNKILSIDPKISNLTKLKLLDVSGNQISSLPQSITQLSDLHVLNISGNPLNSQFDLLLKKENQSDYKLQSTLKTCFGSGGVSKIEDDIFPSFGSNTMAKPDKFGTTLPDRFGTTQGKPSWLDQDKNLASEKPELNMKRQLSETESLLAREQQKVIELKREIENLRLSQQEYNRFQMKGSKNEFGMPEEIAQLLEIDFSEIQIKENISQGGFSIVQRGIYRGTNVAVKKIFNPNITQELKDDISNEVEMLNRLRHPNIVLLMGVCSKPPNLCIITEHLPNASLFNLLHMTKTDFKPELRLTIAREIAIAINYLHLSDIVHRDIKSHNVLLDENFRVKLCDFGLARSTHSLNKGSMQFSGTPCYMAPEIFQKRAYDEKIDVFAFGTLIWELFSRKVPFEGLEPADVMQKVLREDQLSTVGVPKKISQLVSECRTTDPKKRPGFDYIVDVLNNITSL